MKPPKRLGQRAKRLCIIPRAEASSGKALIKAIQDIIAAEKQPVWQPSYSKDSGSNWNARGDS